MPLFDYVCPDCGHTCEALRKYEERHNTYCNRCLTLMEMQPPLPHIEPDGIYSYAPNLGTEEAFERKRAKIRKQKDANG